MDEFVNEMLGGDMGADKDINKRVNAGNFVNGGCNNKKSVKKNTWHDQAIFGSSKECKPGPSCMMFHPLCLPLR